MRKPQTITAASLLFIVANGAWPGLPVTGAAEAGSGWQRHTIDDSLRGADGVRLGDFDGDGLSDVVTGWEESGTVRLYLNPGPPGARDPWPAVTVSEAASPEDAVPMDVDDDGRLDVVSCHEGSNRSVFVAWNRSGAGGGRSELLDSANWHRERLASAGRQAWMYALPLGKLDERSALVVGSKGGNASITLLLAPRRNAENLGAWRSTRLRDAGWIMSLRGLDMDGDGDHDVLFSDRKGGRRGVGWLENPAAPGEPWAEHSIGGEDDEVMFLDASPRRVRVATRNRHWLDLSRSPSGDWQSSSRPNPAGVNLGKAIVELGSRRLVMTANTRAGEDRTKPGIWAGTVLHAGGPIRWTEIDSTPAVKFDRMETIDLDGDGDLDVMTCEERQNLGVVWYENPG
jgi:hypothetical protein